MRMKWFFYKRKESDIIWWKYCIGLKGVLEFSFDKKKSYNYFTDYPKKLTKEEKTIFDKENPHLIKDN